MFQRIQGVGLGLLIATAVVALAAFGTSFAQNAPQGSPLDTSFTYQGRLEVDGIPADGVYDFEFEFWDAPTGGTKLQTLNPFDVPVTNGQFAVLLNGGGHLQGEQRYLAVSARPVGGGSFVSLGDRQELTPAPYAIYARTAGQLSSEAEASFIQNGTSQQPTSNFNISGNGTAAATLSANVFAINGAPFVRKFGTSGSSFAVGPNSGLIFSTGADNTILGSNSALSLTSGYRNTGVGSGVLFSTTSGLANTVIGYQAGVFLETGSENVFVGHQAGAGDVSGSTGSNNVAVGSGSGFSLLSGGNNALFGDRSGEALTTGSGNTLLGKGAGAIQTSGNTNVSVGIDSGSTNTSGNENTFIGPYAGLNNVSGNLNVALGTAAGFDSGNLTYATAIGSGSQAIASDQVQLGRNGTGTVRIGSLTTTGLIAVCVTADNVLATCGSSLRYKTNLADYTGGLDILAQLRPVTFDWKQDGTHDLGFVAEDVAAIDPLLATYRDGVVEGVKYDRISAVLVNSVMEQQDQIDAFASGVTPADDARLDALEAAIASDSGSNIPGWLYALAGAVLGSLLLPAARKVGAVVR